MSKCSMSKTVGGRRDFYEPETKLKNEVEIQPCGTWLWLTIEKQKVEAFVKISKNILQNNYHCGFSLSLCIFINAQQHFWHRLWRFPSAAEKWSEIPWIFPHEFHEFRRDYGLAMNWVTASQSVLGIPYGQLLVTSLLRPPQCTCITNSDAVDEEA